MEKDSSQIDAANGAQQAKKPEKKERSFGNKAFDIIIWPAFQWIGVWGTSLVIGLRAQYGNGFLNKAYKATSTWLESHFEGPMSKPFAKQFLKSKPKEWAEAITLFTALCIGGTIMTPIVKFFEHRREKISRGIDTLFNKTPKDPSEIKEEPKQTWFSVAMGRLASIGVAYATLLALGPRMSKKITDMVGTRVMKLFNGNLPTGTKQKIRDVVHDVLGVELHELLGVATFDLLFSSITASVNYSWSRFVAFKEHHLEEPYPEHKKGKHSHAPAVEQKDTAEKTNWAETSAAKKHRPEKAENFTHAVAKSRAGNEQAVSL